MKPSAASRYLVLSPESPDPPVGGGALRTASLIAYLQRRGTVDVIVPQLPHHSRSLPARAARNLLRAIRRVPPLIDRFSGLDIDLNTHYDLAVIEHFWCAPYYTHLAQSCDRVFLNLHNIESTLAAHCARSEPFPISLLHHIFARAYRDLESDLIPRFDAVLVPSAADAARLPDARSVIVYPNTIPFVPQPRVPECHEIAFSGNFEYHPNRSALRWFLGAIWPILKARHSGLRLRLIGKNPPRLSDPRIDVTGPVPDAIPELARARLAIAPILAGSGTRLKIVEAWAAARPVVSTVLGAEGLPAIPDRNVLLADTPTEFADAVTKLLQSLDLRVALGTAGRAVYERELTWNFAWNCLDRAGL